MSEHHNSTVTTTLDLIATAADAGSFTTLIAAVTAAELGETLKGAGPFTIFAPNDEAFAKLPADTLQTLLQPQNKEKLVAILTYHVVPGTMLSKDLAGKHTQVSTVQGNEITIDAADDVRVNDATVLQADLEATNGVIHVIDRVMMPPAK